MSVRDNYIKDVSTDARWFLALKAIHRPLLLHSLAPDAYASSLEKAKVFSEVGYNPVFTYPHLNLDTVVAAQASLIQLRLQVCQEESNKSIATVYSEKLDELILEQELLVAAAQSDGLAFAEANSRLYKLLDATYVQELLALIQNKTDFFNGKMNVSDLLKTKEVLPKALPVSDNLFKIAQKIVYGPDIVVGTTEVFTSELIVARWNESLKETMPDWKVAIDTQVTSMLVVHKTRTVKIPPHLKMNAKRMRKLFVHEIGTHVYRREQGKKNKLQLASIGLAGNQVFEEGLAIVRAQLVSRTFHQFGGLDKYLTLAIAMGNLDGVPKDFNQTFSLVRDYFLDRLNRKRSSVNNLSIAESRAWNCTFRIFRGGNPSIPGCCLLKDKIYHEGNRIVWQMIATHPEYFKTVMQGKYNPQSSLQRKLVQENAQ